MNIALIVPGKDGDLVMPPANPWEIWPNKVTDDVTRPFGDGDTGEEARADPHHTRQSPKGVGDGFGDEEIHTGQSPAVDVTNSPMRPGAYRPQVASGTAPEESPDAARIKEAILEDGRACGWPQARLIRDHLQVKGERAWRALVEKLWPEQLAEVSEVVQRLRQKVRSSNDTTSLDNGEVSGRCHGDG
jgi:hypothetical protein